MSELSFMGKLMKAMELSKAAHTGLTLTYFDVIELSGEIEALKGYIAELEAENAALKAEPKPLAYWSDEKKQTYADNEGRSAKRSEE